MSDNQYNGKNRYNITSILQSNGRKPLNKEERERKKFRFTIIFSVITVYFALVFIASSATAIGGFQTEFTFNPIRLLIISFTNGLRTAVTTMIVLIVLPLIGAAIAEKLTAQVENAPYVDEKNRIVIPDGDEGASRIMTEDSMREVFSLVPPEDVVGRGYILGIKRDTGEAIVKERGRLDFAHHMPNENAGAIGPSGTGKSTCFIQPNMLNSIAAGESMVCLDPKGPVYRDMKGIMLAHEYRTFTLIVKASQLSHSDGWDCLRLIREAEDPVSLAVAFADTMLSNIGSVNVPYWGPANNGLLALYILYVTKAEMFEPVEIHQSHGEQRPTKNYDDFRTWREVANLINNDTKKNVAQIKFAITQSEKDKRLLSGLFNSWANGDHTDQIHSGLSTALQRFTSETVVDILSTDEIRFEYLQEKACVFIISDTDDDTYTAVATLFFNQLLYRMKELAEKNKSQALDRFLAVYIDELPSIGRIPKLENYMKTVRSYNIGIFYIAQSISDLYDVYGTDGQGKKSAAWLGLLENSPLQMCLGANSDEEGDSTKNYFSKRSGIVTTRTTQTSMNAVTIFPHSIQEIFNIERGERTTDKGIPVYSPDDIGHIKFDEVLISPEAHDSMIQGKYHWSMHPLYDTMLIDKKTGEEAVFLSANHIPPRKGGDEDDMSKYVIVSRSEYEGKSHMKKVAAPASKITRKSTEEDFL